MTATSDPPSNTLVLMGVCGAGKSLIGPMLGARMNTNVLARMDTNNRSVISIRVH
jgi:shikimate kinase